MNSEINTKRPIIKVGLAALDIALETFGGFALLGLWIVILMNYSNLPDSIPTHFNGSGQPDKYSSKGNIFTIPILASILYLFMTLLNRIPHLFNYMVEITEENALRQYTLATRMIRYLKAAIVLIFGLITLETIQSSTADSPGLSAWFLPLTLGIILIPIVFFIAKSLKTK